jgi:cell division septation protein DedD
MRLPLAVLSLTLAAAAGAQPSRAPAPDSGNAGPFARARRMVADGNGVLGRILVDSALAAATPGTPAYAEALYWRATLAERSSDAERDYRQIAVEYPQSERAADALVRLAQLDLVRGQPDAARDHLTRLLRDHADAPTRARAQYWLARAALDASDPRGACDALNGAAGEALPGGDLARQVVALRARVPRCTLRVAIGGGPDTAASATAAATTAAPDTAPDTAARPVPNTAARAVPNRTAPAVARGYSVQVAAYDSRAGAEALVARLVKRGFAAHVASPGPDTGPFRVRVGRWATRAEAAAAQRDLKAKGLAGFVAEDATP